MRERDDHRDERSTATLPSPWPRCQICGAPHTFDDPVLCRICDEPVLLWGWAP